MAAVRFVNLTTGAPNPLVSFIGTIGAGGTLHQANMSVGAPTAYAVVPSGANSFTILHGHDIVLTGSAATLSLQGGSVNTLAVVRNAAGGFQLVNLPRCS